MPPTPERTKEIHAELALMDKEQASADVQHRQDIDDLAAKKLTVEEYKTKADAYHQATIARNETRLLVEEKLSIP